ncbi:MAG: CotH kinase family protein, partial [Planctomycetes bacterium]|nr:CotH kinase family protein [Planctomycetota bacterium]
AYNTWEGTGDSSLFFSYDSRTPFWYRWLQTADFLQLWKDRWYELRQGPMDTASVQAIIDRMTGEIRQAAIRDQAKWNQTTNWLADVTHLRTWLTNRILWIDSQFARPPSFFHDGVQIDPRTIAREIVAPGYEVTVTAPAGTIFCTLDGSDPRLAGGGLSPIAQQYTAPIAVDANSRLVARARISTTNWSAPAAATFVTETPRLVISEMMYHPFDPLPSSPFDAEDFEFVELVNTSAGTLDLSGFRFTAGIEFVFSPDEPFLLERGEYAIIVSNLEAFSTRYDPTGIRIAGQYAGLLNNAGDQIRLEGPLGEPIHDFTYSDLWYPATDGDGDSLNIYDPWDSLSLWESEESWAPSSVVGGTPGREDPGLSSVGGRQRPSDSNQDGAVDLSDAISLLIRLFTDGSLALPCEGMSLQEGGNLLLLDASGDASVDVSDAIYLLNYLFLDGPPPSLGSDCIRIEGCPSACSF